MAATKQRESQASGTSGISFDAGGLIALDCNIRRVLSMLAHCKANGRSITVPAAALAQALRNPAKQARLSWLIRQSNTAVLPLDASEAVAVGRLLALRGQPMLRSEPDDLLKIAPTLRVIPI